MKTLYLESLLSILSQGEKKIIFLFYNLKGLSFFLDMNIGQFLTLKFCKNCVDINTENKKCMNYGFDTRFDIIDSRINYRIRTNFFI